MLTPLSQIEAATALIIHLQQANDDDDGMVPIYRLGTTIAEVDDPPEILTREQRSRQALLALAAAARSLITMIEDEEAAGFGQTAD
jgi:hypothetical protein